jgi:hypothetical protein
MKGNAQGMEIDQLRTFEFYRIAKNYVLTHGYEAEVAWQKSLVFASFSESDLLREASWVILCSGFREAVVRRSFDFISLCFCDWESAATICKYAEHCEATALTRFANRRKIRAIIETAQLLDQIGFEKFKLSVLADPIASLKFLPFIGDVTSYHLAKNLGLAAAKPDRHLQRLAAIFGYRGASGLCLDLSKMSGDSVPVVDLVLWRFAERNGHKQLTPHLGCSHKCLSLDVNLDRQNISAMHIASQHAGVPS